MVVVMMVVMMVMMVLLAVLTRGHGCALQRMGELQKRYQPLIEELGNPQSMQQI